MAFRRARATALVVLLALAAPSAAEGPSDGSRAPVPSAIAVQAVAPIRPVRGADELTHLVYELMLVNQSELTVTVDSVTVLDGASGAAFLEISGDALAAATRQSMFGGGGTTLAPSGSALVFIDAALAGEPPASLRHRIATTRTAPVAESAGELGGLPVAPPHDVTPVAAFRTAPVPVDLAPAVSLAPPVRGDGWLAFRACCALGTSHRGGTVAYDGVLYAPERFAIDFVRFHEDGRLVAGPPEALSSYRHYGSPVIAVADGIVAAASDGAPDQVPGLLPEGLTAETAGGNAVLLDIGGGRFAFYAHLKPGSVRVAPGDRVRAGDPIGLIGNSGRSVGPHLHFHVTDAPSPAAADGLPYVFTEFTGQGVLVAEGLSRALAGQPGLIDREALAGRHRAAHPLNGEVLDFGP